MSKKFEVVDGMYEVFKIPKRSGGFRQIEKPVDELKNKQRLSYLRLRSRLWVSPYAHAFRMRRNIVSMAVQHAGRGFVLALDLSDFFPSIRLDKFVEVFKKSHSQVAKFGGKKDKDGKSEAASSHQVIRALRAQLSLHFHDFRDGKGERLPQGAPASPFLSNVYLHRFDHQMGWLAAKAECVYNRYADDLVFSGDTENELWRLRAIAGNILEKKYELALNTKKIRMMPATKRQLVCGLIVNDPGDIRPTRRWRRELRTAVHCESQRGTLSDRTKGRLAFMYMVENPPKGVLTNIELCRLMKLSRSL